ncbi:MAG: hypothetical protein KGL35_12235 [Bradyrhizobium sp.]|uniref:hypothetical protein n=1 Tax=Bradyrhizobium sp. TaxID=376 RepID=UPI001C28F474|nr:hypothetical protein [Bradyrhizobium sp.]MBU6463302.1 hypothetical protein [Pseudomonadota bacterium]MDE2068446.1 hypothetical protein [Bradyrhizobium sp.]MDE2469484.1 hypothetical protein [Bradyrhizobium sp.]
MTDIRPFEPKRDAPLTAGARFIRGFTRVGMVVAVLIVLIGVTASIITAKNNFDGDMQTHQSAECVARLARSGYEFTKKPYSNALDYDVGGCYAHYTLEYKSIREVLAIADAPASTFLTSEGPSTLGIGLMITGGLAVVAYLIFWCIGWLCAGFTRDA